MTKPIIATKLVNVIITKEPFEKFYYLFFESMARKLDRPDIKDWKFVYKTREECLQKMQEVINIAYPDSDNILEKTKEITRKYILKYIDKHPETINEDAINQLEQLKEEHLLALISRQDKELLIDILQHLNKLELFDIIETEYNTIEEFTNKYQEPIRFIQNISEL